MNYSGDPTLPTKGKRNKLYDDTSARSGDYIGDTLSRDFSRKPIDVAAYKFDTQLVDEGEKVMLLGDPKSGRGTIVVDRSNFQSFSPELPNKLRKQLFEGTGEDRAAAINFMKERGLLKGDVSKMTRQNFEDVLVRFEDSLPELNDLNMYDQMSKSYAGKKGALRAGGMASGALDKMED